MRNLITRLITRAKEGMNNPLPCKVYSFEIELLIILGIAAAVPAYVLLMLWVGGYGEAVL